jgi:hypothetical protein
VTYATQRDAISRTPQALAVVAVRECANHYSVKVQQLLTYTEQFSNAIWVCSVACGFTDDNAEAPDGTMTAETLNIGAVGRWFKQTVVGTAVTSKGFTGSIWFRAKSGFAGRKITIRVTNVAETEIGSRTITLTESWQRFWVHKLFSAVPVDDVVFKIEKIAGDTLATGEGEVWGANLIRNPADEDEEVQDFPYVKRVAETVTTLSVNASRCDIADQGDGNRCLYSRPTCQYPDGFNAGNDYEATAALKGLREFRFCMRDAPLPVAGEQFRPYIRSLPAAAQEIDPEKAVTMNERLTLTFDDDADPGVWNADQSSRGLLVNTQTGIGTFWRRFSAVYHNYGNPEGYVLVKRGFVEAGAAETDYQTRGTYLIRNLKMNTKGQAQLICTDRLKLTRKSIPEKTGDSNLLTADITDVATTIPITDAKEIAVLANNVLGSSPDYTVTIEIDPDGTAEKCNVTDIDLDTNQLTVTRGRWGTSAAAHLEGVSFRQIYEFGTENATPSAEPTGKNPITCIIELLRWAGLKRTPTDEIDTTTLEAERDTWLYSQITPSEYGFLFRRTLTEQTALTDDANIVAGSVTVDDNSESRLSRVLLAYDPTVAGTAGDVKDFSKIRVELDIDVEERTYYGEPRLEVILDQWIRATDKQTPRFVTSHLIERFRHGSRLVSFEVEIKDDGVSVGDYVQVDTDRIQDVHGNNLNSVMYVLKKKPVRDNRIRLDCLDTGLFHRPFMYAPDGNADYDAATDTEKKSGYLSDDNGFVGTPKVFGYVAT